MTHSGWNFLLQQFCFIKIENLMSTVTLCLISPAISAGCVEATFESTLCPDQYIECLQPSSSLEHITPTMICEK